jgi:hypothetical protein
MQNKLDIAIKTHFIPTVCAIKPPAIGPTTGPRSNGELDGPVREAFAYRPMRGPRVYNAMADALSRSENKSPTDPPPTAIGAPPDKPAISRY